MHRGVMQMQSVIAGRLQLQGDAVGDAVRTAGSGSGGLDCRLDIAVSDRIESVEPFWRALEAQGTASVYQRYEWIETSLATLEKNERRNAFIVTGALDGEPAFLLPMSIRGRLVRELSWVGGSHANFNMGLFSEAFLASIGPGDMARIMARVRRLVPGIGYIKLCCQPLCWKGITNPMAELPHQRSMNPAFVMHLAEGFEALLARGNAKRKRKKFRQQCREAEAAGGYRLLIPADAGAINRVLDAFFRQKSERLRAQGIRNVFGSRQAQHFLRDLALRSIGMKEPLLRLFALEIGGTIRAVFGAGIHEHHMSGYFSSISTDELTQMSPGEMLLYMMVEHAVGEGHVIIDLGAGDERYKRSWCDERLEMFDVILPASVLGTPFALQQRVTHALKRFVRETPALWSAVIRMRRLRGLLSAARPTR